MWVVGLDLLVQAGHDFRVFVEDEPLGEMGFLHGVVEGFHDQLDVGIACCQLVLQLHEETAGLAAPDGTQGVVQVVDLAGPLELSVEMVGKNSLFFLIIRKMAFFSDGMWNETAAQVVGRQYALVDPNHVEGLEIEVAGLKDSHDLEAVGGAVVDTHGAAAQ